MTGTDPLRGSRGRRGRRTRAVVLALLAFCAVALPGGGVAGQEPQAFPVRSGSGWLGVHVRIVNSTEDPDGEITLSDVLSGSPAWEAGLEPGDRVIRLNGVPVSAERFRSLTSRLEAGDPVALTVLRGDQEVSVSVVAGERPAPAQIVAVRLQAELDSVRSHLVRILDSPPLPEGPGAASRVAHFLAPTIRVEQVGADSIATRVLIQATGSGSLEEFVVEMDRESAEAAERALVRRPAAAEPRIAWLQGERQEAPLPARSIEEVRPLSPYVAGLTRVAGAQLRSLGPGLGQYFQVDRGLLVTEVAEGTPAAVAGLRGGDVIVAVGGREVTTLGELRAALATGQGRVLEVVRRGERLTVTLR